MNLFVRIVSFLAFGLLWLPAGILLSAILRGFALLDPMMMLSLLPAAPGGFPLALACFGIWRVARWPAAAGTFAVLAPVTVVAGLAGGLFGPLGVAGFAALVSAPSWVLFGYLLNRRRRGPDGGDAD